MDDPSLHAEFDAAVLRFARFRVVRRDGFGIAVPDSLKPSGRHASADQVTDNRLSFPLYLKSESLPVTHSPLSGSPVIRRVTLRTTGGLRPMALTLKTTSRKHGARRTLHSRPSLLRRHARSSRIDVTWPSSHAAHDHGETLEYQESHTSDGSRFFVNQHFQSEAPACLRRSAGRLSLRLPQSAARLTAGYSLCFLTRNRRLVPFHLGFP